MIKNKDKFISKPKDFTEVKTPKENIKNIKKIIKNYQTTVGQDT
jgi:hypothetical protein